MKVKTKELDISGARYEFRRFTPEVGSYILMQIIGAGLGGKDLNLPDTPKPSSDATAPAVAPEAKSDGEDFVRGMVLAAFLRGMDRNVHGAIQRDCLACVNRLEGEVPMPITSRGVILPDIAEDLALVMKLEMEVLAFNFADFFNGGGLNNLTGNPAPPKVVA